MYVLAAILSQRVKCLSLAKTLYCENKQIYELTIKVMGIMQFLSFQFIFGGWIMFKISDLIVNKNMASCIDIL